VLLLVDELGIWKSSMIDVVNQRGEDYGKLGSSWRDDSRKLFDRGLLHHVGDLHAQGFFMVQ
jgi:hypothetical protein